MLDFVLLYENFLLVYQVLQIQLTIANVVRNLMHTLDLYSECKFLQIQKVKFKEKRVELTQKWKFKINLDCAIR